MQGFKLTNILPEGPILRFYALFFNQNKEISKNVQNTAKEVEENTTFLQKFSILTIK